jgi:hypothetical protein
MEYMDAFPSKKIFRILDDLMDCKELTIFTNSEGT